MRSIPLLLPLILLISHIEAEESKEQTVAKNEVKYVGPIVYSDQKPPIVVFPTPPSTSSAEQNTNLSKSSVEYVPFPYQELPVLIYKSKDSPPIHMVSETQSPIVSNDNNVSNIDKRLGETVGTSGQRGGRALKWSNFKLFSDKPVTVKSQKWGPSDPSRATSLSHSFDMKNNSFMAAMNNPMAMATAPHVLYSGHPPIHVFPQPIIIKEPEIAELTAASEAFPSLKSPNTNNFFDISMSPSNKHEVSTSPPSTQFYSYGGKPVGSSDSSKTYGFRVKTKGNKHDTDYSSSTNYENYDEYSPQHSDGSSDSHSDKFRPSTKYSNSLSAGSDRDSDRDYDKDYDRPVHDHHGRDKSRDKYSKYASNQWMDWDVDNGWLTSLLGYNRYPMPRPRRPVAIGLVNSPTNEQLMFAASQANPLGGQFDLDSLALMSQMNPHMRHNGWMTGVNAVRPTPSAIRPVYSFGGFMGYRRPPVPAPASLYTRFNPSIASAGSSIAPISMKPVGFVPPYMGLPSVAYPVRIPYSPLMMYGLRRPPIGPGPDLAFAESTRNTTNKTYKKWKNSGDDFQMSGSYVQPSYALPPSRPTGITPQNKPPIIIYQGLRPPIHVYKNPNATNEPIDSSFASVPVFESLNQNSISDEGSETTTTTTTQNPYFELFSSAEPTNSFDPFDNQYRSDSYAYLSGNSGFSPRQSTGDWIPVKQQVNNSQDGQQNN